MVFFLHIYIDALILLSWLHVSALSSSTVWWFYIARVLEKWGKGCGMWAWHKFTPAHFGIRKFTVIDVYWRNQCDQSWGVKCRVLNKSKEWGKNTIWEGSSEVRLWFEWRGAMRYIAKQWGTVQGSVPPTRGLMRTLLTRCTYLPQYQGRRKQISVGPADQIT